MGANVLETVIGVLTEQDVHGLDSDKLYSQLLLCDLSAQDITHHHFLGSFGLLVLLAEVDDSLEIDLLRVLDDNLEAALVVFGVLAVFLEGDDDFLLILSVLVLALQEHESGWS